MRTIALCLLIPFLALTGYALMDVGYFGILDYHRHSSAGWQVVTDLVLALLLVLFWLVSDARQRGIAAWPWVLLTLTTGSIGPLAYLVVTNSTLAANKRTSA